MKKILSVILALIMCAALALPAFADGMGPFMEEITAYVNKEGGAEIYDYSAPDHEGDPYFLKPTGKKIPDKTKLSLTWYTEENDELWYNVEYDDGNYGFIRAAELSLDLKPVEPKEKNKYDPPHHFTVINKEGAKLYAGPGLSYEELAVLPEGTEIEALYADGYDYGSFSSWSYIEFEGKSGWVHTGQFGSAFDFAIPVKYHEYSSSPLGKIYVLKDLEVYDRIDWWEGEVAGTIPAGAQVSFDCYYNHEGSSLAPVSYDGIEGWVKTENVYLRSDKYMSAVDGWLMVTDSTRLYEDDNLKPGGDTGATVDSYRILPYDLAFREYLGEHSDNIEDYWNSAYEEWFRVTVDGEKYWLRYGTEITGDPCIFTGSYLQKTPGNLTLTVYEEPDDSSFEVCEIKAGEEYINLFNFDKNQFAFGGDDEYDSLEDWYYIEYEGQRGWIHYGGDDHPEYLASLSEPVITFAEDTASATDESSPAGLLESIFGKKDDKKDGGEDNPLAPESPRKTITGSVIFAAVAVVLAVIGISRARKKKEE